MNHYVTLTSVVALNLTPVTYCVAAEQNDATETTVVVTGTRTEKALDESPVPIRVISRQDIIESGATRLDEILNTVNGMQLMPIHGQQGQQMMMQGMDSQYVLLLIDGVPVSQTGESINIERINLANVERIEIAPGASSALYGSSAMGGVVNIITEQRDQRFSAATIKVSQAEIDSEHIPSQTELSLQHGQPLGSGYLNNSLTITRYAGVNVDSSSYAEDIANGYRWNLDERYRWGDYRANLNWSGGLLKQPSTIVRGPATADAIRHEDSHEITTSLQRKISQSEQLVQLEADWYDTFRDITTRDDSDDLKRKAQAYGALAQSHWNWQLAGHQLTYGAVLSAETLHQSKTELGETVEEVPDVSRQSAELFAQDDWQLSPRLELVAGLRTQWDSDFNWFAAPKIAGRWDLWRGDSGDLFLRSSAGLGYRIPSLKERHYEFDHSSIGYVVIGDPSLQPEKSVNIQAEVGGNLAISNTLLSWSVNAYRQDISDLIDTVKDEDTGTSYDIYRYTNVEEAVIQGVEASVKLPFSLLDQQFQPSVHYQYLDAVDGDDHQLADRPEHQLTLKQRTTFNLPTKPVWTVQYRIIGRQVADYSNQVWADSYSLLDSYLLFSLSQQWQLQFSAKNLTNQYSKDDNDAKPIVGRTWALSLMFNSQ